MRLVARECRPIRIGQMFVSTSKGIEVDTFKLMSQGDSEELPDARGVFRWPQSGEGNCSACMLTSSVIASEDRGLHSTVQQLLYVENIFAFMPVLMCSVSGGRRSEKHLWIASGMADAVRHG